MRQYMLIVESEQADPPNGTIVSVQHGDDFDVRTFYFLKTPNGWRRLLNHGLQGGVYNFEPLGREHDQASLDDFHTGAIVYPAPKPGERIRVPAQMLGFPEDTIFNSPSGVPMHRVGDKIEYQGQLFDLSAISNLTTLAETQLEEAKRSKKAERFIKKHKQEFKDRYGDAWERVLYATANKKFN
jgi:hypothetical protein